MDVRNGILSRQEAMELIKKYEKQVPGSLKYYLEITELKESEFYEILKKFREDKIKDIKLPVENKMYKYNKNKNRPFVLNFIEEIRNENKNR